jgi:RNA polymerase sigma-70 factor, ECF subfamily
MLRKQRMSFPKSLSLFGFRGHPVSSERPLPVHCINGVVAMSCDLTTSHLPAWCCLKQHPSTPGSSTWNKLSQNRRNCEINLTERGSMNPSYRQLKLTDAPSDPMVRAASAGLPPSKDGKAFSTRSAQVVSAVPRGDANRDPNPISDSDRNARFAGVVLPHLPDAYALARWLTGNRSDAEDVVQDACLRAFRGIGNFSNGNARAWVLTIVRHTAYNWLGKNRPTALVLVEDVESVEGTQSGEPDVETPETSLIAKADAGLLEAAIAALPAPFRGTLVLRDVQGLAYREIAEVMDVPIGTVISRLARARHSLMAIIAKDAA